MPGLQTPASNGPDPARKESLNGSIKDDVEFSVKAEPVLDPSSLTAEELKNQVQEKIKALHARLGERTAAMIGYPINHDLHLDYSPLHEVESYKINNVGDPFQRTNYDVNTHDFELGVIQWFARLWEIELEDAWGYVSNGGTESNIQGILLGRETLPDAMLYHSRDSHYSVRKAGMLLRIDTVEVGTLPSGEIDYDQLRTVLVQNRSRPAILALNIGTTVRGAVDDPCRAVAALDEAGYTPDRFYIHCDGALAGIMLPFMTGAPKLSFRSLPIASISVSGHKFLGVPDPCGVILARRSYVDRVARSVEYLFVKDVTLTCSRNGHTPLFLWYTLSMRGTEGVRRQVQYTLELARTLKDLLDDNGIPSWLNPWSTTVVFERPRDDAFVREWQLASQGDVSHVVVMPSLTEETVEVFVDELVRNRKEAEGALRLAASNPDAVHAALARTTSRLRQEGSLKASSEVLAALKLFAASRKALCLDQ